MHAGDVRELREADGLCCRAAIRAGVVVAIIVMLIVIPLIWAVLSAAIAIGIAAGITHGPGCPLVVSPLPMRAMLLDETTPPAWPGSGVAVCFAAQALTHAVEITP